MIPRPPCEVCGMSPTHRGCATCDPEGFQARVVACVREIAATGQIECSVTMGKATRSFTVPASARGAQSYLIEIGAEPRPAKRGRAA